MKPLGVAGEALVPSGCGAGTRQEAALQLPLEILNYLFLYEVEQ